MLAQLFVFFFVAAATYIYFWATRRRNYWRDRGVQHVESTPLLGSFCKTLFLKESVTDAFDRVYWHPAAKEAPFVGVNLFHKPAILVRDPELIKRILVKDFNYFNDRHTTTSPDVDPVSALNLFLVNNPLWRLLRIKLSPVFTSGKMKLMFYLVEQIGNVLNGVVKEKIKGDQVIEVRGLFGGYTIDTIALVAFATQANCLKDNETSLFKKTVSEAMSSSYLNKIGFKSAFLFPSFFNLMKMTMFSPAFNDFIRHLLKDVMSDREKSKAVRHDLIDALVGLKKADEKETEKSKSATRSLFELLLAQTRFLVYLSFHR